MNWMLSNTTKKSFRVKQTKDEGISEWINTSSDSQSFRKKRLLSYLKAKTKQKVNKYTYELGYINEQEMPQGSEFSKYHKAPLYTIKKQYSSNIK